MTSKALNELLVCSEDASHCRRHCFTLFTYPHQPVGAEQLLRHVTRGASDAVAAAIGEVRLSHVFLEVEVAAESTRADRAGKGLNFAVRVHVKRQVVHLQIYQSINQSTMNYPPSSD